MNTWNTFRDESYSYPNMCAQCAAPEPSATWELKYCEIEFPEGMPVSPYDQKPRNYNTYITNVPVCGACLAAMRRRGRNCWLAGAAAGAASGLGLLLYLQASANGSPGGALLTTGAAGVFVSLAVGYLLKVICVDSLSFAKYNGREQRLKFANKEFQAQYDRLNFQYSPQTGQYAGAKGW